MQLNRRPVEGPTRDLGRRMNGRDAEIKDDFKSTHEVGPRSPFIPPRALLLKIFWKVLIETRAV